MNVEIILSGLALLLILAFGRVGMVFGAFYELTSSLLLFLAMLVTLRFWHPLTAVVLNFMPGEPVYAALGAYWTLFLIGCVPLIVVMNRVTEESVPHYPKWIDVVLGGLFGLVSATIIICCVMTSLSVVVPKVWGDYDRDRLLVPLDRWPITAYQYVESEWVGISPTDPQHTRLPSLAKEDADDPLRYWK